MSLSCTIDSGQNLVTVTADGSVTLEQAGSVLAAIAAGNALPYRKLLDFSNGTTTMTEEEMLRLAATIRHHQDVPLAALAVVIPERNRSHGIARILGILAAADRPMRVFTRRKQAQRWLDAIGSSR